MTGKRKAHVCEEVSVMGYRDIDVEALREAVKDECAAACFGGGIGPALLDVFDADSADEEEQRRMAKRWGIDVSEYEL